MLKRMTRTPMSPTRWGLAAIIAAAAIVGPVGFAMPASAHNVVTDSTPQAGDVLTELPDAFSVTTNEPMLELDGGNGFAIQIRDAAGLYYGDGCVTVVDATLSAEPALGAAGAYTMLWQAVSADGHTIDGEIPFTWQPSGADAAAQGSATPAVCGAATPEPSATPTSPPATEAPVADRPEASGIDLVTVLWVGGVLVAVGIAVAVAIVLAARRRS